MDRIKTYFHLLWHSLRLRWDPNHRAPLTVNIQITNQCPNSCLYCSYKRDEPDLLTLDILKKVFQDIWMIGGRRINLTGGEPLLRNDLKDIVRSAKEVGFFISISTSGAQVDKQLDALCQCDRVMLSFDGPPEIRKFLCGDDSIYETETAINLFRRYNIPFWTTTVLTRVNIPYIDWIVDHAQDNSSQANFVLLMTQPEDGIRFHPSIEEVKDLMPNDKEYRDAIKQLIDLKKKGSPIGSSLPYLQEMLNWSDYTRIYSSKHSPHYRCLAGRASCELLANGLLYSCGWGINLVPGISILEAGFNDAFYKLQFIPNCNSCVSSCQLESNLIFSLNSAAILNWLIKIKKS